MPKSKFHYSLIVVRVIYGSTERQEKKNWFVICFYDLMIIEKCFSQDNISKCLTFFSCGRRGIFIKSFFFFSGLPLKASVLTWIAASSFVFSITVWFIPLSQLMINPLKLFASSHLMQPTYKIRYLTYTQKRQRKATCPHKREDGARNVWHFLLVKCLKRSNQIVAN